MRRVKWLPGTVPAVVLTLAFGHGSAAQDLVAAPPEWRVGSAAELASVLGSEFKGRVIVPRDADWEMIQPCGALDEFGRCVDTPMKGLTVQTGVELIGERGDLGRRPILRVAYKREPYALFLVEGTDSRVSGLHLVGPAAGDRSRRQEKVNAIRITEDPVNQLGRRIEITDNEIEQWTDSAVNVGSTVAFLDPAEYDGPRIRREDAGLVRVERNYIHHNARDSAGYGVVVGGNAYATIIGNVFDFNRHAVTSSGYAYNGYVARFNYVLRGGYTYGSNGYYGQHFDVHGTGTPEGRANHHYDGGRAGEFYDVGHNTIRGEQDYGGFLGIAERTRAAFELRGRTADGAHFHDNVVVHDDREEAVRLKAGSDRSLLSSCGSAPCLRPSSFNLKISGNRYDTDYSTELATGDFDADGRTDVFLANGTGWFHSRAGIRPWEYLRASNKRVRDLGFADITNDGVTDVLYRDGAGNLGYVQSGTAGPVTPLTTTPVPIGDLRFGDFDGDLLTDIFFTRRGAWQVWYGRTRTWTPTQTSSARISELLFGEFDDIRGTDVVAVRNRAWSISSGSTQRWARLNDRLVGSFDRAVAADFDGNGVPDIAFDERSRWRFSPDGRGRLRTLRRAVRPTRNGGAPLKKLHLGRFDGGTRTMVIGWPLRLSGSRGDRMTMWHGLGSADEFVPRSEQNMR